MTAGASTSQVPTITLSGGTQISKVLELDQPFVIGSAKQAQFRIPHPSLQPQHARLHWNGRFAQVEAASPEAVVLLQGKEVKAKTNLRTGDILRIGDFEFHFKAPKSVAAHGEVGLGVLLRGKAVFEVPMQAELTFGSGPDADVLLDDDTLLPIHAVLEKDERGFVLVDKGGAGLLANGRYFERHSLLIGDRIDFGDEHAFTFEGWALRRVPLQPGCALTAQQVEVKVGDRKLLQHAGFAAEAGEFVGIIGPSGAGKTTLLRTLCGLTGLDGGTILLNQTRRAALGEDGARYFGYVPQKEIIHLELTGRQALRYAAALRLPAQAPVQEIEKLIEKLAGQLGLGQHLDTPARRLSGGQLKRLSVAVEMLSRPPLLLLDEPTSGLDPESEAQLMRQLRDLTASGCTVICATHLMENVHLMDSVEVLSASVQDGEAGGTVFRGRPSAAREFFKVKEMAAIYARLHERKPSEWRADFETQEKQSAAEPMPPAAPAPAVPPPRPQHKRRLAVPILLRRQWDILRADVKNVLLLIGQPVLIGLLLALAAGGSAAQTATQLFLACIATFWMACGNAAPEVVRERAIFERERFAGLSSGSYLWAKFVWLSGISLLQALVLYGILKVIGGVMGNVPWQMLGLAATTLAATGLGLAISAWSRNVLQAVLLVPVFTIPQILFSGYVFTLEDWQDRAAPRVVSRAFPGFASQRLMDTSLLWQQTIGNYDEMDQSGRLTAYENLSTALRPYGSWLGVQVEAAYRFDEAEIYSEARGPLRVREGNWDVATPLKFRLGASYAWSGPAWWALLSLAIWMVVGNLVAWVFLRQQRE